MTRDEVAHEVAETTKFEYLLNAMENAGSQDYPSQHDYYGKRQAVLKYVAELEAENKKLREALKGLVTDPIVNGMSAGIRDGARQDGRIIDPFERARAVLSEGHKCGTS